MSQRTPFEELEQFLERMRRQFDESGGRWELNQWTPRDRAASMDLADHGDAFVVTMDLPGFAKDDVDVRVTDRTLHVDAEHTAESDEETDDYIHHERSHESVSRRVHFPDAIDTDAIDATLRNGVLTVSIGKVEPSESGQEIEIE